MTKFSSPVKWVSSPRSFQKAIINQSNELACIPKSGLPFGIKVFLLNNIMDCKTKTKGSYLKASYYTAIYWSRNFSSLLGFCVTEVDKIEGGFWICPPGFGSWFSPLVRSSKFTGFVVTGFRPPGPGQEEMKSHSPCTSALDLLQQARRVHDRKAEAERLGLRVPSWA